MKPIKESKEYWMFCGVRQQKAHIIASIVQNQTACLIGILLEDETFQNMFYDGIHNQVDLQTIVDDLVNYANNNLV